MFHVVSNATRTLTTAAPLMPHGVRLHDPLDVFTVHESGCGVGRSTRGSLGGAVLLSCEQLALTTLP